MELSPIKKILLDKHQNSQKYYFLIWLSKTHPRKINNKLLLLNKNHDNDFLKTHQVTISSWFTNVSQIFTLYLMNVCNIYSMIINTIIDHPFIFLILGYIIDYYLLIYTKYSHLTQFLETNQINFNRLKQTIIKSPCLVNYTKICQKINSFYQKRKILFITQHSLTLPPDTSEDTGKHRIVRTASF